MRLLAFFLSLLPSLCFCQTQALDSLAQRVDVFGRQLPQEKVFLHTDNTSYFLGDTIFFQAYVTRSDNGTLSRLSGVLYVELLSPEGFVLERQLVNLKLGLGTGSVVLHRDKSRFAGYYELRAYTRWMLNFGRTVRAHNRRAEEPFMRSYMAADFFADYDKLYSRVFPVYDAPQSQGEFYRDMTARPKIRLTADVEQHTKVAVSLYPEGGNLVKGLRQRVFFEAATDNNRHVRGSLSLLDAKDQVLATADTEHRGKGVLTVPQVQNGMRCVFVDGDGNSQKVPLPPLLAEGVALNVEVTADSLLLSVSSVLPQSLALTVMNSGVVRHREVLREKQTDIALPLDSLPQGVLDVTVFDGDGRIWADRLVFNASRLESNRLIVEGVEECYAPYAPISAVVRRALPSPNKAVVSISVVDAETSDPISDSGSMLTEMLLASEVKGFIECPEYYFRDYNERTRRHLDLLMATQGWRRFSWKVQAHPELFKVEHLNEQLTARLEGEVVNYEKQERDDLFRADAESDEGEGKYSVATQDNSDSRSAYRYGKLKNEVLVHAEFISPTEKPLLGEMMTENGAFCIDQPSFEEQFYMHLAALDSTKVKSVASYNWVDAREDEYPPFYVRLREPFPRFPHPYGFYQTQPPDEVSFSDTIVTGAFDDRLMKEIVVRHRRSMLRGFNREQPVLMLHSYDAFNMVCDAGLCPGVYFGRNSYAAAIGRVLAGIDMGVGGSFESVEYISSPDFKRRNPKYSPAVELPVDVYLNGEHSLPLVIRDKDSRSTLELDKYNHLMYIDSVYVYTDYEPRRYADKHLDGENQPHVIIDLHSFSGGDSQMTYRDRFYVRQGFNQCEDFYHPDYSRSLPDSASADHRRTLLWLPLVMLDNEGKAMISTFNNCHNATRVRVTVNGIDSQGTPLAN